MAWDTASSAVPLLLTDTAASFLYGPDDTPIEEIRGTTSTYLMSDQLGSTILATDPTGATTDTWTYNSYGAVTAHTGTTPVPLLYAGQYQDTETGLYYLHTRYYDPTTGQFLTRDPLEAQTGQPYQYAANNPINNTDPSGLLCILGHNTDGSCRGSSTYNWAVENLDPAYTAINGYYNEWQAAENGCSGWTVFTYAAQAVAGVAATAATAAGAATGIAAAEAATGAGRIPVGPGTEKAWNVLERVNAKGSPLPGYKGGSVFENAEGRLPGVDGAGNPISYREWDVNPYTKGVDRGPERVVTGSDGSAYFTGDHYDSFLQFWGPGG